MPRSSSESSSSVSVGMLLLSAAFVMHAAPAGGSAETGFAVSPQARPATATCGVERICNAVPSLPESSLQGRPLSRRTREVSVVMRLGEPSSKEGTDSENLIEKYRNILADIETTPAPQRVTGSGASTLLGSILSAANFKTCETDIDCLLGERCFDLLISKICVADDGGDDGPGGGGRIASMAMEPIPVRIEDGYYDDDPTTNSGGACVTATFRYCILFDTWLQGARMPDFSRTCVPGYL